jgi:tripartite-type tricarboxylate transporter receptor subunit TctC
MFKIKCLLFAPAAVCLPCASHTQSESFPVKTIRVIVPFAPGGSADLNASMIAPKMSELLGQSIVVDNRAGASGNIGSELVARAAPDGYTLLLNSLPFVVNPLILGRAPYHPVNDFAPVSILSSSPSIVTVHPSVPVSNIKELLALARAKPGALNYASAGVGTNPHVAGELFNQLGKVNLVPVHFKGGGPGLIAAMSGEVGVTFTNSAETSAFVRAKKLKALAITSARRAPALPEIPTVAESGLPTYEFMTWFVLAAPAKTSRAVVAQLNDALRKTLATPDLTRMFNERALDIIANAPDAAADYLKRENERWARLVKERGLKSE